MSIQAFKRLRAVEQGGMDSAEFTHMLEAITAGLGKARDVLENKKFLKHLKELESNGASGAVAIATALLGLIDKAETKMDDLNDKLDDLD